MCVSVTESDIYCDKVHYNESVQWEQVSSHKNAHMNLLFNSSHSLRVELSSLENQNRTALLCMLNVSVMTVVPRCWQQSCSRTSSPWQASVIDTRFVLREYSPRNMNVENWNSFIWSNDYAWECLLVGLTFSYNIVFRVFGGGVKV